MNYSIQYSDPVCSNDTAPDDVVVPIKKGKIALNVMEEAVTMFGSAYRFSATYFGGDLGYFIDTINGTSSDVESSCFWFIYILDQDGNEILSPVGVSNLVISKRQRNIIWRYERFQSGGSQA